MDRHFVLQKEYTEEPTGMFFEYLFKQYCNLCLDSYEVSSEEPLNPTVKSKNGLYDMKVIPVGYIQFVSKTLHNFDGVDKEMTPLEIPVSLERFMERKYIREISGKELIEKGYANADKYFVKNIEKLKKFNSSILFGNFEYYINPSDKYSISERVDFDSEYRCLICNDELVDIFWYIGDKLVFPDSDTIKMMIKEYKKEKHPKGYTLDIGITKGKTVPIEVHPFVSCGIYGMTEEKRILDMLEYGFDWYNKENVKERKSNNND